MTLTKEQQIGLKHLMPIMEESLAQCEVIRDALQTAHADLSEKARETEKGQKLHDAGEAFEMAADRLQDAIDHLAEYQKETK